MATVPGRSNVVPMMPEWAKPTQADFLQAAAIMHERDQQVNQQTPGMFDQLKLKEKEMEEGQEKVDEDNRLLNREEGWSIRKKPEDQDI